MQYYDPQYNPSYEDLRRSNKNNNNNNNNNDKSLKWLTILLLILVMLILFMFFIIIMGGLNSLDATEYASNNDKHCDIKPQSPACSGPICKANPDNCPPPYDSAIAIAIPSKNEIKGLTKNEPFDVPMKKLMKFVANLHAGISPKIHESPETPSNYSVIKIRLTSDPVEAPNFTYIYEPDISTNNATWVVSRGTDSHYKNEVFADLKTGQISVETDEFGKLDSDASVMVHKGFYEIYKNIKDEIERRNIQFNNDTIVFSGHSLGSAIAILLALHYKNKLKTQNVVAVTLAGPRVGNQGFTQLVKNSRINIYRLVNSSDIIPQVPVGIIPNLKNHELPYIYYHVGKLYQFTNNWGSLNWNHFLNNYIYALKNNLPINSSYPPLS